MQFARDLYADEPIFRFKPRAEQNGWLLAVLQNKLEGDRTLNMAVTLEKTFDPAETVFEQLEPKEVWMELEPARGDGGIVGLRWGGREEYPAAAWELDVPEWPADADGNPIPARLRAWWDKDGKAPAAARLERARGDFDDPLDIRDRPVDGGRPRHRSRSRASRSRIGASRDGPTGPSPAWSSGSATRRTSPSGYARRGSAPSNAQHRFYSQAGRYAGVFWPLNEDQVRNSLDAIEVVSVEAFRKRAQERGDYIEIGEAGEGGPGPRPGGSRPAPADRDRAMTWTATERRG